MALKQTTNRGRAAQSARALRRCGLPLFVSVLLAAVCLSAVRLVPGAFAQEGAQGRGSRPAGVTPKRQSPRTKAQAEGASSSKAAAQSNGAELPKKPSARAVANSALEALSPLLAAADFDLVGLAVTANPPSQTVPKNTPTSVLVSVKVPEGTDPAPIIAGLNPEYRVRGELTGPSLSAPRTIEAPVGQPLPIPPLAQAGEHLLQNLRVVDTGRPDEPVVAAVTPDACGITVIERLLVSEVHVNELTYEQIVQAGINISDDSYRAFNFTVGLGTISEGHSITIPVAFPSVGVNASLPVVGTPTVNAPGIDAPTVIPVLLTPSVSAPTDGSPAPEEPKIGDEPVRIPGVVVFPGRVGFLHQFFEAIVIVSNGAPNGAPLVLRNLHAKSRLPDAGTPGDESDDPLRIAETQTGGRVSELDLHGLGADQKYGTADDTVSFRPGEAGQATFLLEGLKDGLHTVDFDLSATLEGLPSGPVQVQGTVPGAVLVRDASFAVTFTHPGIVRAGQEYDLAMTVTNTGSRDILGAFARLNRNGISGAELIGQDAGERQFPTTIVKKDSATIKWRLRASVTGEVTASYVKVGDDVSAGLQLVTGVGDRNIPLSPESLILPDPVRHLPPDFVEAARGVLGQGWSIANAPPGSLPAGVLPVTKQSVIDRAVELGLAGMRVDFGETSGVSIETLMRDWLGELKQDAGFADALRETPSGNAYYDAAGTEIYKRLTAAGGISAADYQRELADTESSRSPFISALVTHADGQPAAGVRLVNASNERVGFGASASEREVDLDNAGALVIGKTDAITRAQTTLGQLALASNVAAENWKVELTGWREGAADLSLLYAASGRTYRQVVWSGVPLTAGSKYRVSFRTLSSSTATPVLEIFDGTNYVPSNVEGVLVTLDQPAPRLVGAIQVTPDVVAGGDKYGRLVGLLFSKPMLRDQAESISRYAVGGGQLKNTDQAVGGPVKVKGAHLDYGDRFAFLSLDSPVGPYIKRDITVTSMSDARRMPLASAPVTMPIDARVSPEGIPPGAYLTGRVLNADGTPVAGANVIYWTQECPDPSKVTLPPPPMPIAVKTTDAQGRYEIDYVRDGDCAPLSVTVNNPVTHSEKRLTSPVAYDGQHMVFDMVFLARGNVAGRVTVAGQPVAKAFVNIVPALDVVGTQVVETDENGRYTAAGVPVGNVSVFAVGTGDLSNSSGFGAGNIDGPNQTATVNISMQNTGGRVTGRVVRSDGGPAVGALVVAYAVIPGVPSQRGDGATAVGYAYADRDGQFTISKIPVGDVVLETTDYVNGMKATQRVTLTNAAPQASNILITLPGLGAVSGRVLNETGEGVSKAIVTSAGRGVETDAQGFYTMTDMPAGTHGLSAIDPATLQTGAASALVRIGQTTENVNIVILRPSTVEGTVTVLEEGQSVPKPVAGAYVSSDGTDLVQTDGLGHYKLPNVTPNEQLTLRVFDTKTMFVSNLEIRLAPGETLTRDVTFRPGTIRGRVTQPDGVTGTVADLQVYSPRPYLKAGLNLGLLDASNPATTRSAADGSYTVTGNNPGAFRVSTSNAFFPTPVSAGGLLAPSGVAVCDLSLVSTLAGKIQGRVFQPDGTTPVGPGVNVTLGGGSLADATVRTDANGHYEFGEVFSAGAYRLTATDPVSGASNRINVAVQRNKDAVFDLRLLGTGSLRVKVVDGGGQPVQSGSVTLDGSAYPNTHRFAEITPDSGGVIAFDNLPEGAYAVAATERGLGGRVAVNVTPGGTVETTIQLQASGTVEGRVLMPGGTVPVGLADVELRSGGRSIGFAVTTDVEGDADASGHFQFLNVPAGDFTIEVFDNRTGRAGRSAGRINTQDETATVNVQVFAIGAVAGRVTSNGQPVDHALVEIYADGAGLRSAHLKATTDEDGRYRFTGIPAGRFTVNVSGAPGGQGGSVSGVISGTNEPLPDTIADIALEPTQTVTGTVYKLGGTEPLPGALVTIYVGPRVYRTNANDAGVYRLSFVTLGSVIVRAEAPAGYDRGEAPAVAGTTPGATITSNVTLAGVGRVAGTARDNNGAPLNVGTVTFSNNDWTSTRIELTTSVRADGTYKFDDVPVGNFTLKLTAPNRVGTAAAAGAVAGGQTANVDLRLEDAGRVVGRVVSEGAGVPVAGADVTLTLYRQTGGTLFFYAHSDSQGAFAFESIPLGTASVAVSDTTTGGVARASNLALAANAQVIDFGDIRLDATPVRVESVTPADGTGNVSPSNAAVTVNFSEPAQGVNSGSVRLLKGSAAVGAGVTLSPDGRVATLTPSGRLADTSTYTVVVSTSVQDLNGLALASEFRSSFTTRDETGPVVTGVTPADGAAHLPLATDVVVTFDEPLDPAQDFSAVLRVTTGSPAAPVAGTVTRAADGKSATFHATAGLVEGVRHTVTVASQRDALGNVQTASFSSSFTTLDTTPPVVDPLPIDGTTVRTFRPAVTATYHDNASGVSTSSVVLTLDGANVTAGATVTGTGLSYTPAATLARGAHTVTLRVSDNQENVSDVRTATFHIDDSGPVITGFTVAGAPAVEGMFVTSSLQPVVAVTYSDDTGIDPSATQVLFGPRGSTLQPVAATVTQTGLTYQPAAPLAEGEYTVEATIVNNLGTSTATPRVNFTLDVDAPEIISLTPSSGSQHGGTTVTMTGNRLLNTTGTAPAVNVGGSPALIKSAEPGTPDTVVFTTPAGAPGPTAVEVRTDRGRALLTGGFNYEADPRTPFSVEPDTTVLWHLDETGNGAVTVKDSAGILAGTASTASLEQPGRFMGGRSRASLVSITDIDNVLNFGASSFTAECWVKTGPVNRTYTLVGKTHSSEASANYIYGNFALQLLPSGALRALLFDTANIRWQADMPATAVNTIDNQWHAVAMVVNREQGRLSLYVDGVERASAAMPSGFGSMISGYPLRAGTIDDSGPQTTGTTRIAEFTGTLDEVRVSASAHSPEQMLATYRGTEGTLGLVVLKYGPQSLPRGTTVQMPLTGYNLSGVTASVVDAAGVPQVTRTVTSSATNAVVEIDVSPTAALGATQVVFSSPAGSVSKPVSIVELGQSVYDVEPDTRVLWHLDESGDGAVRIGDSATLSIDGTASSASQMQEGRFGRGRSRASLVADTDFGALNFGASSFTAECWVKTGPVNRTYTLVGKNHSTEASANYIYGNFALQLLPSGALRALLFDTANIRWQTQMAPLGFDVDDNQWHAVAMVVNREQGRLSIYVDGQERAFAGIPAGFGSMISGYPLRAGTIDDSGPQLSGTRVAEFPGTLDEIRVSASARPADRIRSDFDGNSGLRITSFAPSVIKRSKASPDPLVTTIDVLGYDLSNVAARVERNGQPLAVGVQLVQSTYRSARLNLTVPSSVPLGTAKLVLSQPNQPDAVGDIYISEHSEFAADVDTVVLWHLNEDGGGAVRLQDGGPLSIDGTANSNSSVTAGHFGNGRNRLGAVADTDFGALNFGASSFTAECWVKTGPVNRTYTLVGKNHSTEASANYIYGNFALQLLPSGAMRALLFDTANIRWQADMSQLAADVDDNQWHMVSMVVNREQGRLSLYVDGVERAFAGVPAGFGSMISGYPLRAGTIDDSGPLSDGPRVTEFTGALDEIRISSTAHSSDRVFNDAIGSDAVRFTWIQPTVLQRGTSNNLVTITGSGLLNAALSVNRPEVTLSSVNTTQTQVTALVTVPQTAAIGPLQFTVTEPNGQSSSGEISVVDQKPFAKGTNDNNSTVLLWHLDETGGGAVTVTDSAGTLNGTASGSSAAATGRFTGARSRAGVMAGTDTAGVLNFGASSFTAECWVKTGPVNRTYTLVGKNHSTEASANYIYGNFALQLLPSGAMRALLFDTANIRWQVDVPKAYSPAAGQWLVSADDDRWHLLSMVVNREQGRLSLYVDGIERGSAAMPAGFGSMISGYPLRAGTIDDSGPLSDGPRVTEFTGALDEIRLVRYARTAAEIHDTWFGVETAGGGGMSALAEKAFAAAAQKSAREGMTVESLTPSLVGRDSASGKPLVTPVTLTGRGLEGVQAQVLRDGKPAGVNAQVESSADGEARLSVSVEPSAPLGPAVLVLSKPGQPDRWVELRVAEQSEFAVEPDTLLLWHMDEPEAGAARLADAGPRSVEATAGASSVALPGRFGGARARAQAATGGDIRSLPFGRQSFTVEAWMKAGQTGRDYVLVGKGSNPGTADDWALKLLASGELRAQLFDTDGRQWAVERQADLPALSDERWHSVALVVDREAGRLTLYVDGAACATSEPPADFGEVRSLGHMLQAGHADAEAAGAAGAEEFPGALDELRISSTAHSPEKVAADFFGHDAPEITFARPANVPRGAERFAVTLFGYGLAGATVGALPEGVRAEVVSSTRTRVELLLSVPASAPPGPFQLGLSDPLARSASVEMSVSEAAGARGGRQKNAPATVAAAAPPEPAARSLHEDRPPRHPAPPEPPAPNSADYSRGGRGWRR